MAEEAKEIQFIDWRRCFAFLEILRSFRIAIHPVKIFLCFVGIVASVGAGVVVDQIPYVGQTNVTVPTSPVKARVITVGGTEFPLPGFNVESERTSYLDNVRAIGTRSVWGQWALPYVNGKSWGDFADFALSPVTAGRQSIELIIAYWQQAWLFAPDQHDPGAGDLGGRRNGCLADGGGADRPRGIRADEPGPGVLAQEVAERRHEPPLAVRRPGAAWPPSWGRSAGLPMNIPYVGEIVVGLFWGVVLAVGFVLAMIFIGGAFSVGLQWPALAVEGTDSFDAISRSVSYISSRPWRYVFYVIFSAVYGSLTFVLVKLVAFLTLYISHVAVGLFTFAWGSGGQTGKLERLWATPTIDMPWPHPGVPDSSLIGAEPIATWFVQAWVWVVLGLALAFLFSFFFTSQTVIYFLLRKVVEAKEIEEVYMEPSEEEPLPLQTKVDVATSAAPAVPPTPTASSKSPPAAPPGG